MMPVRSVVVLRVRGMRHTKEADERHDVPVHLANDSLLNLGIVDDGDGVARVVFVLEDAGVGFGSAHGAFGDAFIVSRHDITARDVTMLEEEGTAAA